MGPKNYTRGRSMKKRKITGGIKERKKKKVFVGK